VLRRGVLVGRGLGMMLRFGERNSEWGDVL
jgi:hypothetical protein